MEQGMILSEHENEDKTLKAIVHDSWVGLYEKGNLIQIVEHTMLGNPEDLAEDFCLGKSEFNK